MEKRKELLSQLISIETNIYHVNKALSEFEWDCEFPIIYFQKNNIIEVFNKYINNEITTKLLIDWANFIECREDIKFENDLIQEVIFEIANSEINIPITKDYIKTILDILIK